MAHKGPDLTPAIHDYLDTLFTPRLPDLTELKAATAATDQPQMMTEPLQAQLLVFLIHTLNATRVLEVGVFTGVSTLCMAKALPSDGRITACDLSETYTAIARDAWHKAAVADRIDLRLAPAEKTLQQLLDEGHAETFDLAYIDADKDRYPTYYDLTLRLLRPGGIVALDNMLRSGRVADPANTDPSVAAIRDLNAAIAADDRVDITFLPMFDGVLLARKRPV
ncbi:MAG: class I SAM-dependent methyltransferase [Phycisphaeraceae bacterium]